MNKTIPILCIVLFFIVLTMVYFQSTIEPKKEPIRVDYYPGHGPEALERVLESCECLADPERTCEHTFIVWLNSTHHIINNLCEFIPLELTVIVKNQSHD